MKLSKEERALLSKIIQQEFVQVWAANRAGENKGKNKKVESKHRDNPPALLPRFAFWRWARNRNKVEPTPIVKAASTAE
jgi:hypothetical protein